MNSWSFYGLQSFLKYKSKELGVPFEKKTKGRPYLLTRTIECVLSSLSPSLFAKPSGILAREIKFAIPPARNDGKERKKPEMLFPVKQRMNREILLPKSSLPQKWEFLDAVVVLNLFERKDRLDHAFNELAKLGLADCCYVVQSEKDALDTARGCYESHRFAAQYSLQKQWKRTLILEDKFAVGSNEIAAKLKKALDKLPQGWLLLKIGHVPVLPLYDFKRKIWKGRALQCTAQVISSDFAEWLPKWKFVEGGSLQYLKRLGPKKLDRYLMAEVHHKTYLSIPSLVYVDRPHAGCALRTQVFFQYLFPLVYVLICFYIVFRIWHTKNLVKNVLA